MSVDDQRPKHFDLELHSGLFYECGSPDYVLTCQCLPSISGNLDIARRLNSKMAVVELGRAAISDALKWMPGRCARGEIIVRR